MSMRHLLLVPALLAASAFVGPVAVSDGWTVRADIINREGQRIGAAHLRAATGGVLIQVHVSQLAPGTHAIYIHAVGKCDAPDFASAGAQFDPYGLQGGKPAGDSPNFDVDASGDATMSVLSRGLILARGRPNSVFHDAGAALVIHENAYDYKAHPAGKPGRRLACGVIFIAGSGSKSSHPYLKQ
jgi:Cu-Zn family superoxide dismutase